MSPKPGKVSNQKVGRLTIRWMYDNGIEEVWRRDVRRLKSPNGLSLSEEQGASDPLRNYLYFEQGQESGQAEKTNVKVYVEVLQSWRHIHYQRSKLYPQSHQKPQRLAERRPRRKDEVTDRSER